MMETGHIFIGGLAHTGKTQLRQLLNNHSCIQITRRTNFWDRIYGRFNPLSNPANFERCLSAILNTELARQLHHDPVRIRHDIATHERTYAQLFTWFYDLQAQQAGKIRGGEQLKLLERFADLIFATYPHAKMIQMIRNPIDRLQAAADMTRQRPGKPGWAMARWLFSAQITQRQLRRYPERYLVLQYEMLLAQPEKTAQRICTFLGEQYEPEMLADWNGMPAKTEKDASFSVGQLSAQTVAFTQRYARPYMIAFDYPLQPNPLTLPEKLTFLLYEWPANRAGMALWNIVRAPLLGRHLDR